MNPYYGRSERNGDRSRGRFASQGRRGWGPFSVEWDIDIAGPRRGGRRRFDGDELGLILLALIGQAPRHGYDLIREIERRSGGAYAPSPGVVYPTLTLLEEMGQIAQRNAEGTKKQYAITADGEARLAASAAQVDALLARLEEMADVRARSEGGSVRRAMHNLKAAVIGRVRDDIDAETTNAIVDILDDAARRIERL